MAGNGLCLRPGGNLEPRPVPGTNENKSTNFHAPRPPAWREHFVSGSSTLPREKNPSWTWAGISSGVHRSTGTKVFQAANNFSTGIFKLTTSEDFWATEASFRFIMVGYNLMSLFRHFALNHHNRATLKTLKSYCFALGAWTVNHANKKVLKISLPVKRRPWLEGIFSQISNLSPPFHYANA